ncbi:MAG TPA: oligopeptide/dipeptide ABC transporter ATP-binding protein [Acetobacteraceae bacterium]|jgi:peptide/nickel transport system ATP-binding protein|nr:oligopeptide/dipeptide ABC transporter ATP-binding protein [Acetobacteraceae bacterium]
MNGQANGPLLEAIALTKRYRVGNHLLSRHNKVVHAVERVSLAVRAGETLGLVGESGCGKSTLGRCLIRLYEVSEGRILFEGTDITFLGPRALGPHRERMQMVFQDPSASLNPRRRVGELLAEPLIVHRRGTRAEIRARVRELLREVGLRPEHDERFPHEFSGGQQQRIGIARALALAPRLIVADEPVSALDASVQAQIVNLFMDLQERLGLTYIFIAHDLSVVRQVSTRVAVMYLGAIVEIGATDAVLSAPAHPYTQALISAVPVPDPAAPNRRRIILEGDVPSPIDPPSGCPFHPRCSFATERCRVERPALAPQERGWDVACHHPLGAA